MKKREKSKKRASTKAPLTIFERALDLQGEILETCKVKSPPDLKLSVESPAWRKNIFLKLRGTILKSFLKLKPRRNEMNWRNYGRIIGCLDRYKAFWVQDVPRILKEAGLDKITDGQWKQIWPELGVEKARQRCLKFLNRPADDPISDEKLFELALARQLEHHEKLKQIAYAQLATRDAKTNSLFQKGVYEGYTTFLNVDGQFSGDDRRFVVYCELLVVQDEIEKMRRSVIPKTRNDLRAELKKSPLHKDNGQKWFNDVCDEIGLSMKIGGGRPYKFASA